MRGLRCQSRVSFSYWEENICRKNNFDSKSAQSNFSPGIGQASEQSLSVGLHEREYPICLR